MHEVRIAGRPDDPITMLTARQTMSTAPHRSEDYLRIRRAASITAAAFGRYPT
jgi:hypothetical protein